MGVIIFSAAPLRTQSGWAVLEVLADREPDQLTGYPDRPAAEERAKEEAAWSIRRGIPAEFRPYEEEPHVG